MSPSDYRGNQQGAGNAFSATSAFEQLGGAMAPAAEARPINFQQLTAPPQGELVRIYERLTQFHARICDMREMLMQTNDRLGLSHTPQAGPEQAPQPPQAEGMLHAIESQLQLVGAGLYSLNYEIERTAKL